MSRFLSSDRISFLRLFLVGYAAALDAGGQVLSLIPIDSFGEPDIIQLLRAHQPSQTPSGIPPSMKSEDSDGLILGQQRPVRVLPCVQISSHTTYSIFSACLAVFDFWPFVRIGPKFVQYSLHRPVCPVCQSSNPASFSPLL